MKLSFCFILVLVILSLTSCWPFSLAANKYRYLTAETLAAMDTIIVYEESTDIHDVYQEIHRAYRICIQGNGKAFFESLDHFITDTLAFRQLARADFDSLLIKVHQAKFFSSLASDLCDTTFSIPERRKTITVRMGLKQRTISTSMKCLTPGELRFNSLGSSISKLSPITIPELIVLEGGT